MSKQKCTLCGKKSNRACPLADDSPLCSSCCAEKRGAPCGSCRYYAEAESYAIERYRTTGKHRFQLDLRYEDEIDALLEKAEKGNRDECAEGLEKLAPLIPDSHVLHFALGTMAAIREDYPTALSHFNRSIEIFPYYSEAWYNKAGALQKLRDAANMIRALLMVQFLEPPDSGLFRRASNDLAEWEEMLLKTSHQTIKEYLEGETIFLRAFDQLYAGEPESALKDFAKVLESNPEHVQSLGNSGLCHAMCGRREEALAMLDRALALDPDYLPAQQNRRIFLKLKPGERFTPEKLSEPIEFYKEKSIEKD